jgi:hypothetical protein
LAERSTADFSRIVGKGRSLVWGGPPEIEMEWSEVTSKQFKLVSAGIGAGALVAMGVVGFAVSEAPSGTGPFMSVAELTLGETTTETNAPLELETSVASPTVTAEPPAGFGFG